ncbi:MAG: ACT domain-containing protein [Deltaproteobacteria bacterium]|nr:ACT domain-containing protein [Deltaproteobacteria bacterium]MBW1930760.1 ACT domain-containing protein [Deltaproteobacteria bacterium]MBW2024756.1 ACT domain-containing protein [Deltaproteobacteria bacterium]
MATLTALRGEFGICRHGSSAEIPAWAKESGFFSITRTPEELSVVCSAACIPRKVRAERGWRCLKVEGPLDFGETGVVLSLAEPLARAGVSIFVVSTYETDYLLVRGRDLKAAVKVLRLAGHKVDIES